jgi:hypothetical protein
VEGGESVQLAPWGEEVIEEAGSSSSSSGSPAQVPQSVAAAAEPAAAACLVLPAMPSEEQASPPQHMGMALATRLACAAACHDKLPKAVPARRWVRASEGACTSAPQGRENSPPPLPAPLAGGAAREHLSAHPAHR